MSQCPSYAVSIYIAGDIGAAKTFIQKHLYARGGCFTVTPTSYLYTGGCEEGMVVGLINYPRFPSSPELLWESAVGLARALVEHLGQKSCSVVGVDKTEFISITPPGAL